MAAYLRTPQDSNLVLCNSRTPRRTVPMNSLVRPRNSGLVHIDAKILSGDTRSGSFNRFIHFCHSIIQPEFSTFFPGLSMFRATTKHRRIGQQTWKAQASIQTTKQAGKSLKKGSRLIKELDQILAHREPDNNSK